jgi:hypothetical protein
MDIKVDDRRLQRRQYNRDKRPQFFTPKKYTYKQSKYIIMKKADEKRNESIDSKTCESRMLKWERQHTHEMLDKYYGNDHFVRKRTAREKGEIKERIGFDVKGPTISSMLKRLDKLLTNRLLGLLFQYDSNPGFVRSKQNIERRNHFNNSRIR